MKCILNFSWHFVTVLFFLCTSHISYKSYSADRESVKKNDKGDVIHDISKETRVKNFGIYGESEIGTTSDDFVSQADMMDAIRESKNLDQYRYNTFVSYFQMRKRMRFYAQTMEDDE